MGSGDLNLKKSWHPNRLDNQKKLWEKEREAARERQKIAELQKERTKEAEREHLERQAIDAGIRPQSRKLEWMYQGQQAKGNNDDDAEEVSI